MDAAAVAGFKTEQYKGTITFPRSRISEPCGAEEEEEVGASAAPPPTDTFLGGRLRQPLLGINIFVVVVVAHKALGIFKTGASKCQAVIFLTLGVTVMAETSI